jgi:myo-inositol-1(or 4)-monophosphatase
MYFAAKGEGAWRDKQRIHALDTPMDDSTMLMLTSNLIDKHGKCPGWAARWLSQTTWKIRILGSAAMEASQVAAGTAHGCVTLNGKIWDVAAPAAIVIEAGGLVTSPTGKAIFPFNLVKYTGAKVPFLAAGPKAQPVLLKEIRENP